ncbi:secretin [Vibrio parahaemolyticus]|nr:secretin [Vibrio parahaemolyticus]
MKLKIWLCALCMLSGPVHANVFIKQQNMNVGEALNAIAKDMNLKLVDQLGSKAKKQVISRPLSGEGKALLSELSQIYDFDWYIYGSTLRVQYDQAYINYSYRPKNIQPSALLVELKSTFVTSTTVKMASVERGHSVLFSGSREFVNDAVSYAAMVDKNQFLENENNLELARINFDYLSVVDRNIETFNGAVNFPGAQSLIAAAITNIGQFENVSDQQVLEKAYKVKLSDGEKQVLEEEEKTSKVQVLPSANALLIRGTPAEVKLAKRIAALIDIKSQQLLFSLKVYDVAVDRDETLGPDSAFLNGSQGIYDVLSLPFSDTKTFLKGFQATTSNGMARRVYETNLLVLENQQGHFGRKETATISLISEKQVETQEIEADNGVYVTGRLLPSGRVQAKVEYKEESLDDDDDDGSSQSVEPPKVSSQSLESEVYIQPDQTVILGGFDNTVTQSIEVGVPVLSSIPLLGLLFKNTHETKRKYKRYISISFQVIE